MEGLNALPHGIKGLKLQPLENDPAQFATGWIAVLFLFLLVSLYLYFYRFRKQKRKRSPLSQMIASLRNLSHEDDAFTVKISKLVRLGLYERYGVDLRMASAADIEKITAEFSESLQLDLNQDLSQGVSLISQKSADESRPPATIQISGPMNKKIQFNRKQSWVDYFKNTKFWLSFKTRPRPPQDAQAMTCTDFPDSKEISSFFARIEEDLFGARAIEFNDRENMKKLAIKWLEVGG